VPFTSPTIEPAAPASPPAWEPMGPRVRRQRRRLGFTLDELAAKAGMSKPYLSLIETGRVGNPPSDEKLRRLEQVLQFPVGELVAQAHLQRTPPSVRAVLADLLRAAGELPPPTAGDDDPMAAALRQLIGRSGNDLDAVAGVSTPLPRAPGDAAVFPVEAVEGFVGCPGLSDPHAFAAGVSGDAMAPAFNDGDVVIFSPAAEVRPGDDCFVRLTDGRTTFRRVFHDPPDFPLADGDDHRVRLQPRNERYRPLIVPPAQVAGIYRATFRYEQLVSDGSR
jgi:repressor LexA